MNPILLLCNFLFTGINTNCKYSNVNGRDEIKYAGNKRSVKLKRDVRELFTRQTVDYSIVEKGWKQGGARTIFSEDFLSVLSLSLVLIIENSYKTHAAKRRKNNAYCPRWEVQEWKTFNRIVIKVAHEASGKPFQSKFIPPGGIHSREH